METDVLLKINALDNSKEAFRSLSKNIEAVQKSTTIFRGRIAALQPTFKRMTGYGTGALGAITLGANRAIDSATDLGESMNAVNVIFGTSADKILKFGETAANSVGLSNAAFNQLATNTGTVLSNTGKSMGEVADMTTELAVRAADLASVYNTDVDTAMNAIRSALIGQSEPLRNLGVVMSEAQTKAFALSTGIIEVDREMTEQEKTLARYNFIMAETTKQAGDFANTSEELANKGRILSAQTEDLSAKMGKLLVPIKEMLFNYLEPLIERLGKWIEQNPKLAKEIVIVTGVLAALLVVVGALGIAIHVLLSPITLVIAALAGMAAIVYLVATRWERFPIVLKALFLPLKVVIETFKMLYNVLVAVGDGIGFVFSKITGHVRTTTAYAQNSVIDLQGIIDQFIDPLAGQSLAVQDFGGSIADMGNDATEAVDKIKALKEEAAGIFDDIGNDEASSKRQLAEAIVEQEESIAEKKRELRKLEREENTDSNATRIRELRRTIREEEQALRSSSDLKKLILVEIDEAERRASLTAFELKIEDIQRERVVRLEAQLARLLEIQQEIAAEQLKSRTIAGAFNSAQSSMQSAIVKTREVAETEAERMKKAFDKALRSMKSLSIGDTSNTTPSFSSNITPFAEGGIVTGPTLGLVGEAGPEAIIPLSKAGALGGITINISGNTFLDRTSAERMGDLIISKLQLSRAL